MDTYDPTYLAIIESQITIPCVDDSITPQAGTLIVPRNDRRVAISFVNTSGTMSVNISTLPNFNGFSEIGGTNYFSGYRLNNGNPNVGGGDQTWFTLDRAGQCVTYPWYGMSPIGAANLPFDVTITVLESLYLMSKPLPGIQGPPEVKPKRVSHLSIAAWVKWCNRCSHRPARHGSGD